MKLEEYLRLRHQVCEGIDIKDWAKNPLNIDLEIFSDYGNKSSSFKVFEECLNDYCCRKELTHTDIINGGEYDIHLIINNYEWNIFFERSVISLACKQIIKENERGKKEQEPLERINKLFEDLRNEVNNVMKEKEND